MIDIYTLWKYNKILKQGTKCINHTIGDTKIIPTILIVHWIDEIHWWWYNRRTKRSENKVSEPLLFEPALIILGIDSIKKVQ